MTATTITEGQDAQPGPGRPREFDTCAAVDAGIALIRRVGYEAASLDALTRAMGISRSSFYAAFGSKRGVLLAALEHYSRERLAALEMVAGPGRLAETLRLIAGVDDDPRGCVLVNCLTELAPRDDAVSALGARHMAGVERALCRCLVEGPDAGGAGRGDRARALLALALGVQTLRKGGGDAASAEVMLHFAVNRLAE